MNFDKVPMLPDGLYDTNSPEYKVAETERVVNKLRLWKHHYYNTGKALVPDYVYDVMEDRLRQLDPEHEILRSIGAPVGVLK